MKAPRIVVVGSSNTDMVVKGPRLPSPGETVIGGKFVLAAGGKGANQAVAAARLGAEVTFVAKVGAGFAGRRGDCRLLEGGQSHRLDSPRSADPTGVALILVDDRGENLISVASGANGQLRPEDVQRAGEQIRQADVVVLQLEIPLDTVACAAALANKAGVPVILDPAPAPAGPLDAALLHNTTYLKPNESEAERLTGLRVQDDASAREAAERLLASGVRVAIVTLGAKGAFWMNREQSGFVPGCRVDALDSTAAGDAFSGALACAIARGECIEEAVRFAGLVGALSVTRLGAQPSLPTEAEAHRFSESMRL